MLSRATKVWESILWFPFVFQKRPLKKPSLKIEHYRDKFNSTITRIIKLLRSRHFERPWLYSEQFCYKVSFVKWILTRKVWRDEVWRKRDFMIPTCLNSEYREQANRERFILPEDSDINLFINRWMFWIFKVILFRRRYFSGGDTFKIFVIFWDLEFLNTHKKLCVEKNFCFWIILLV